MIEYDESLKLGKRSAFVKSKLRNLPQTDDVWEVDFQPIPPQVCKRVNQGELWLGLVVSVPQRFHLANVLLEVPPPTVNDLARLLAHAMNRPLVDRAHRPARIYLRNNPQWRELLPHLEQLGIEVVTRDSLPAWDELALEFFRGMREVQVEHGMGLIALPIDVERTYPTLAHWVHAHGRIEIGAHRGSGVMARAFDENGVVFESSEPESLGEALVALERGIAEVSQRAERPLICAESEHIPSRPGEPRRHKAEDSQPERMSDAAGNLAEFAASVLARPESRSHSVDLKLSPTERTILAGLRDLDLALKERLDVPSRGVKSFSFTLQELARICLALSAGLLDAQGRDIVKVLSVAGKVTDLLDHAVGELGGRHRNQGRGPQVRAEGIEETMTDQTLRDRVLARLLPLGEVTSRPMFGGWGIYWEGSIFAIRYQDRLYFKVDEHSKDEYVAKGMGQFRPNERQTLKSYYEVPPDVLVDSEALLSWAREAIRAGKSS